MRDQLRLRLVSISALVMAFVIFSACGGTASKDANSSAGNGANKSANAAKTSDLPMLEVSLDDLQSHEDTDKASANPGRMLKVTGYLNFVSNTEFTLGHERGTDLPGVSVNCRGDFTKFAHLMQIVPDLAKKDKAPEATVQGTFKEFKNDSFILEPCVLMNIDKQ